MIKATFSNYDKSNSLEINMSLRQWMVVYKRIVFALSQSSM